MQSPFPSRRQFLVGAAASSLCLACSSGDGDDGTNGGDLGSSDLSIVRIYGPYFAVEELARIPFGLADANGPIAADRLPAELGVTVSDPDGEVVDEVRATLHTDGIPRPYHTFESTPEVVGFFDYAVDVDGTDVVSQFQVVDEDDPTIAARVGPGDALPGIETPTDDDPRGVTPICTRDPMCDLHRQTVAELVGTAPLALLVATPAFCQTTFCGPILDVLLDVVPDFPGIEFIHAEVYRNPSENATPPEPQDFAPVIGELGLPYEPALFVADADGEVVERLDYLFDGEDMRRVLSEVS